MVRTNRPDEAYHIPTLNFWFAISAIVLFIASVWMVVADHTRSWKQTQRTFRDYERVRLSYEKAQKEKVLSEGKGKEELEKLHAAVKQAEEELVSKRAEVEAQQKTIESLKKLQYVAKQNFQFKKASLDDTRYNVEHTIEKYEGKDPQKVEEAKARLQRDVDELAQLKTRYQDADNALVDAEASLEKLNESRSLGEKAIHKKKEDIISLEKRLDAIAVSVFNSVLRDAPLLDFMVPSLQIKQIVLKDIRDDYNFATVQKEDRCQTCHQGIDSSDHVIDNDTKRFKKDSTRFALERELREKLSAFVDKHIAAKKLSTDVKDELDTFASKSNIGLEKWLQENVTDEALRQEFLASTLDVREKLRLDTATFAAHSNLDLYLSSKSPHSIDNFGCTVCHEGKGHATEFNRVFHTPRNKAQEEEWKKKHGWHEVHYWDDPQLPLQSVSASCAKCHDKQPKIAGADLYNEGRRIVELNGCFGCHRIDGLSGKMRPVGPILTKLPSKISEDFAYAWIWNPKAFRSTTRMPRFFGQTNNSEGEFLTRTQQEVRAMVSYLFNGAEAFEVQKAPEGDVQRGKKLFQEVGCLGCHSLEVAKQTANDRAPDLSGVGSKLSRDWIFTWIKNPRRYFAKTFMPSLRLTDSEAVDIATYLASLKNDTWDAQAMPPRDEELQTTLLKDMMATTMRRTDLETKLTGMTAEQRELLLGEKAIAKYGCTGCHTIRGFENAGPIGTELTTWASKFLTQLDFALVHDIPHTKMAWAGNKLKNPRIYDRGKIKDFGELLKMPNFGFNDHEIEAVVTFLMSRTKRVIGGDRQKAFVGAAAAVQEGRRLMRDYNCYGCHRVDGEGGNFAQYWRLNDTGQSEFVTKEPVAGFDYLKHIAGPVRGHVPPILNDQGNKTQSEWLFGFLKNPTMLRPQVKMRMPTFQFTDQEINTLVRGFAAFEGHDIGDRSSYEPNAARAQLGQELFTRGNCTRCHMFTDRPTRPGEAPSNVVAPNLKLGTKRLQPDWIVKWLRDPQSIMPGANMPNFFDLETKTSVLDQDGKLLGGDMQKGMEALRDYLILAGERYDGSESASR